MALDQVTLEARIAALRRARDSGVLVVRHGEQSTTFRSLKELNDILASLEAELGKVAETTPSRVRYIMQSNKGL